jgi:CubicO group peptidase (beta-lactamase class C family)
MNMRAGRLTALAALLAACATDTWGAAAFDPRHQIEKFVKPLVDEGSVVGAVVGVTGPGGRHVVGFGRTTLDGDRVPNGDTVFQIGSVTKVFTAALLADMVKRGKVALDRPVAALLPEDVSMPARGETPITLRHLAAHTSGLPRMPDNFQPEDPRNPYADYAVQQMYEFLTEHKLDQKPGAKYEYSNLGYGLLGHVLARRAGKSYERLLVERMCTPLGMADTRITLSPDMKERLAQGHDAEGKPTPCWDIPALAGCGALYATAPDLLTFLAANLALKKTPLGPALMLTHQPQDPAGEGLQIALGWHIVTDGALVWHNGGTGGYASLVGFVKAKKMGVVVLTNSAAYTEVTGAGLQLLHALAMARREPATPATNP